MDTHFGFSGGLDPRQNGKKAPYYATFDYELIFHTFTTLPNTDSKKSLLQTARVLITWLEDYEKFDKQALKLEYLANILIIPLKSRLYRIKILTASSAPVSPIAKFSSSFF